MGKVRTVNSLESDRYKVRTKFYKLWDYNYRLLKLSTVEYYAVYDEDTQKPITGLMTLTEAEKWIESQNRKQ